MRTLTLWSLEQVAIRRPWKSKDTSWMRSLWSAAMLRATNMAAAVCAARLREGGGAARSPRTAAEARTARRPSPARVAPARHAPRDTPCAGGACVQTSLQGRAKLRDPGDWKSESAFRGQPGGVCLRKHVIATPSE